MLKTAKTIYVIILLALFSCVQKTKVVQEVITKSSINEEVKPNTLVQKKESDFYSIIKEIRTKALPIVDTTNYDNTEKENLYTQKEVAILQLERIYPDFHKSTHNYQTKPGYKIDFSKEFHSVVLTIFKGDHEIESILINFDLNGNIIDHKVIAYDEIAEGASRIESEIKNNQLIINNIFWMDKKQVTTEAFEIQKNGKIVPTGLTDQNTSSQSIHLIDTVIQQLKLEPSKIYHQTSQVLSNNPNEVIVVLGEFAKGDEEDYELNSHIALVNTYTKKITHTYFESCKSNGWYSDAIFIDGITIDTTTYKVSPAKTAFGVIVSKRSMSQPNPYSEQIISLYTIEKDSIKKVLDNYTLYESFGEVNVNSCYTKFDMTKNQLSISDSVSDSFSDINVHTTKTQRLFSQDNNGECNPVDTILSTLKKVLSYNGKTYEEIAVSKVSENEKSNNKHTDKTIYYSEFNPKKLENIQFPKFSSKRAYQLDAYKIITGFYTPINGQLPPEDTEKDWGDRLLFLDQNNKLVFQSQGVGDVYHYEPHFYQNSESDKILIICQLAFEYPFGGELFILENGNITYAGMLDIEGPEEDKWLTEIIKIVERDGRIEFTFKSDKVTLAPGSDNERIIDNKNVKYVFENNKLLLEKSQ